MVKLNPQLVLLIVHVIYTVCSMSIENMIVKNAAQHDKNFKSIWPVFPWLPIKPSQGTIRTTRRPQVTTKFTTQPTIIGNSQYTKFQLDALAESNLYRTKHCAPLLTLNSTINSIASVYAKQLADTGKFTHSQNGYGENLWMTFGSSSMNPNSVNGNFQIIIKII